MDDNYTTFYLAHKDQRPCWPFVGIAAALTLISVAGILMNGAVIWATVRTKTLRNTANWLLALCSLFELLHQSGHFIFAFTALSGRNFIEFQLAAKLFVVSAFGMGGIAISMLFTGLDRLLCVIFPFFYAEVRVAPYLGSILCICCANCCYQVYLLFATAQMNPHQMITGAIVDIISGRSADYFAGSSLILNTCTTLIYLTTALIIKAKSNPNASTTEQTNRRIFRALFIIVALNIGGYLVNTVYVIFLRPLVDSFASQWLWQMLTAVPLNVSAASNGPVLYSTSAEYRKAFRREFAPLFRLFAHQEANNNTAVQPVGGYG